MQVSTQLQALPLCALQCFRKKILRETFVIETVEVPARFVFVDHGQVHHAGREQRGEHCIRYHTYLIPASYDLSDAIAFGYRDKTALRAEKSSILAEKGLN